MSIQLEVATVAQIKEALEAGVVSALREALLEAWGGVSLDSVIAIAETGVDRISSGSLTKGYPR